MQAKAAERLLRSLEEKGKRPPVRTHGERVDACGTTMRIFGDDVVSEPFEAEEMQASSRLVAKVSMSSMMTSCS